MRGIPCQPGEYHLVVTVWTVNSRGDILLTLRDSRKGKLSKHVGEHRRLRSCGAKRALAPLCASFWRETGIAAKEDELILLGSQRARDSLYDHYLLRRDVALSEIRLQPGETVGAKWVTLDELDAMRHDLSLAKPIGEQFEGVRETFIRLVYRGVISSSFLKRKEAKEFSPFFS